MVQRMSSGQSKVKVKSEADDAAAATENPRPPGKRPRFDISPQNNVESVTTPSGENSPLIEPSPLGLRLKKSPSLLELIQMRLSQEHAASKSSSFKTHKASINNNLTEKLKASNFPASLLSIGTWEYKSKYEGDLVAKCYFAKHKLVWEVLDGALKNKIEIQWSDIVVIKANYGSGVEGTDTMEVVLARQPLFFRETNPQPRKHTLWQPTSDFTTGQASICRRHLMQCTQGLLARHFEKLIQCDPRLNFLSQQPEIVLECPYFDQRVSQTDPNRPFGLNNQEGPPLFFAVPGPESSSLNNKSSQDLPSTAPDNYSSSPSSVMDIEDVSSIGASSGMGPSSISMSDLMSHIVGCCISGRQQRASSSFPGGVAAADQLNRNNVLLEEISRYLLNDSSSSSMASSASPPDRQSLLLSRVNSLYSFLQNEEKGMAAYNGEAIPTLLAMSRKDSVGELLLNLPRIASLPHILSIVSEEEEDDSEGR